MRRREWPGFWRRRLSRYLPGQSGTVEATLQSGDSITIAKEAIHRVTHAGATPAITLHAYSPPLDRVGTYEVAEDGALLRHPRSAEVPLQVA